MTEEISTCTKSTVKKSELDGRMTPDLFGDYFDSKSQLSLKLSVFYGGSDVLKVINERCIVTLRNVAKVCLLITLPN